MLELMDYCACHKRVICKIERPLGFMLDCDLSCCPDSMHFLRPQSISETAKNQYIFLRRDES